MSMDIQITIDDTGIKTALQQLSTKLADMTPAMRRIAGYMQNAVEENFAQEGRPTKWIPSKRALRDSGHTLQDSGQLAASISSRFSADSAMVGTNKPYAAPNHFGAHIPAHDIAPVNKKALWWPGLAHPVKKARFPGADIPARPFMCLTDSDIQDIEAALQKWLTP